jgi:AcrR family transcriptional regulator
VTRNEDHRLVLIERLADYVLEHGLIAASLRPLAKAARTSDRMLLYYFRDKSELISAVLGRVAERMTALLTARASLTPQPLDQLRPRLAAILLEDEVWPFMRLWLEIASRAAQGDPFYSSLGQQIGRGFLAWGALQLESDEPEVDAARLLVTIEGMVLLKSIGLEAEARAAF